MKGFGFYDFIGSCGWLFECRELLVLWNIFRVVKIDNELLLGLILFFVLGGEVIFFFFIKFEK